MIKQVNKTAKQKIAPLPYEIRLEIGAIQLIRHFIILGKNITMSGNATKINVNTIIA